eukprot:58228_1
MNPFASEFVPTIQMDGTEQREFERHHLIKQMEITQFDLNTSNARLLSFHKNIISLHGFLENILNENTEGYAQEQIDEIHQNYLDQVSIYQQDYKKFNDLTSELITLRNRLHSICIMPLAPIKKERKIETANGVQSTPKTPTQILPPIMESDDESSWNELDHDNYDDLEHEFESTNSIKSISMTISPQITTFQLNLPDQVFITDNNTDNKHKKHEVDIESISNTNSSG